MLLKEFLSTPNCPSWTHFHKLPYPAASPIPLSLSPPLSGLGLEQATSTEEEESNESPCGAIFFSPPTYPPSNHTPIPPQMCLAEQKYM